MLYHKKVCIPADVKIQVLSIINKFQYHPLAFTTHAKEQLREELNPVELAKALYHYSFDYNDIFEVNQEGREVEKIGFRIPFDNRDIAFIITKEKSIVTIWTNNKGDKHATLDKQVYAMA